MDIVEIGLRYIKLQKAKTFLKEDYNLSPNDKFKLISAIELEISYAKHLIKNPELITKEIG